MAGFIELFNKFTKPYVHYIFILSMVLLFIFAAPFPVFLTSSLMPIFGRRLEVR